MPIKQRNLITEYLNYFLWFLNGKLTPDELDYMLYLRDQLEKSGGNLGDLDVVWKSHAQQMLRYGMVFDEPLSNNWWWKKSEWEKLVKGSHRSSKKRKTV